MRRCLTSFLCLFLVSGCANAADRDKNALREDIRAVLRENPDLVLDVLRENNIQLYEIVEQGVAAKQASDEKKRLAAELKTPLEPSFDASRPTLGDVTAPAFVVAYSDFLCPYCGRAGKTMHQFVDKNAGKVKFQFKHFPRTDASLTLAKAYEAIGLQDPAKAWTFHDRIFEQQEEFQRDPQKTLDGLLAGLGLDMQRLAADMNRPEIAARIEADTHEAQKFGFRGTPSFVVDGLSIRGAWPMERYEELLRLAAGRHAAGCGEGATTTECLEKDKK